MTYWTVGAAFWSSFFVVFLLGLQSRNVNQERYILACVTSFMISVANFTFIKFAAAGDLTTFFICAAGGCAGIVSSIAFYSGFLKSKREKSPPITVANMQVNVDCEDLKQAVDQVIAELKRANQFSQQETS